MERFQGQQNLLGNLNLNVYQENAYFLTVLLATSMLLITVLTIFLLVILPFLPGSERATPLKIWQLWINIIPPLRRRGLIFGSTLPLMAANLNLWFLRVSMEEQGEDIFLNQPRQ